ncbi:MAG TPA: hypothetical protein VI942_03735 [Thermoanaerobaculia bacterium]|nr:hypothetical protein [Thermoanaerobaculia bacterium]
MDTQKLKEVYDRLESLDDRLGHRLRRTAAARATTEQLEDRVKDLTAYTSELRELVRDLVLAFATKVAPR